MKRSEQCDQLYTALALARANFGKAERTKEAKIKGKSKMSGESFEYTYKYAPLEECFKAIDQALSDQGLALVGGVEYSPDGQLWVITHLGHTSGQWIENALSCGIPQDSKDMGGMITYARRYGVTLTVQMQAEDDDDGPRGGETYQDRRQARKPTPKSLVAPKMPANGGGKSPVLAEAPAMTVQEIISLAELAEAAGLDHSKFGDDMRLLLELEPSAKLTRAFLAENLTREQYNDRWQRYMEMIQELADDVPLHAGPDVSVVDEMTTDEVAESYNEVVLNTEDARTSPVDMAPVIVQVPGIDVAPPLGMRAVDQLGPTTDPSDMTHASKNDWWKLSKRAREAGISTATWDVMREGGYFEALEKVEALEDAKKELIP